MRILNKDKRDKALMKLEDREYLKALNRIHSPKAAHVHREMKAAIKTVIFGTAAITAVIALPIVFSPVNDSTPATAPTTTIAPTTSKASTTTTTPQITYTTLPNSVNAVGISAIGRGSPQFINPLPITTNAVMGYAQIDKLSVSQEIYPDGNKFAILPNDHGVTLQQNSTMYLSSGTSYWLQNVVTFDTDARTLSLSSQVFPVHGGNVAGIKLKHQLSGNGNVINYTPPPLPGLKPPEGANNPYYGFWGSNIHYKLPLNIYLFTSVSTSNNYPIATFAYKLGSSPTITYDTVQFNQQGSFPVIKVGEVNNQGPAQWLNREDLLFAGEGDSETATASKISAKLGISYQAGFKFVGFTAIETGTGAFTSDDPQSVTTGESILNVVARPSKKDPYIHISIGNAPPESFNNIDPAAPLLQDGGKNSAK